MYKRILIATDGSPLSHRAIVNGIDIAKATGAAVLGVHVRPPKSTVYYGESIVVLPRDVDEALERQSLDEDQSYLAEIQAAANDAGIPYSAAHPRSDTPADGILQVAEEGLCDLIVMASHGRRGFSRILLGSEANKVVTHAQVPVLVTH